MINPTLRRTGESRSCSLVSLNDLSISKTSFSTHNTGQGGSDGEQYFTRFDWK